MADDAATKSKLCYVDVDNSAASPIVDKHDVSSMPTLVYTKGGKEVDRMEGRERGAALTVGDGRVGCTAFRVVRHSSTCVLTTWGISAGVPARMCMRRLRLS
mmetsp:Transcript_97323/g.303048  ORF Transcript_97323/g.303048 Transcript_97323/m.303048 type:complete len:102 (+) Transcript_97323:155-460(+)